MLTRSSISRALSLCLLLLVACGDDPKENKGNNATNNTTNNDMNNLPANPCAGIDCSGHGTCQVNGSAWWCMCEEGRFGERCEGAPEPPDLCEGVTCEEGGACVEREGRGACVYQCEGGVQYDEPCEVVPPCAAEDCSGHGQCVNVSETALRCDCEEGWAGMVCELPVSRGEVSAAAIGLEHVCAIKGGQVWCWGNNRLAQLGGAAGEQAATPQRVEGLGGDVEVIAAGKHFSCALKAGAMYCWGANEAGQLGYDTQRASVAEPTVVPGMGSGVEQIALGQTTACALKAGAVWCWGGNRMGQNGQQGGYEGANPTPRVVPGMESGVISIALGGEHSCAIKADGVYCWGFNRYGQSGEDPSDQPAPAPRKLSALDADVTLALGGYHSCALDGERALCWGHGPNGQTGHAPNSGTSDPNTTPHEVFAAGVSALALGAQHSCALYEGEVYCWGHDDQGQLGDVRSTPALNPTPQAARAGQRATLLAAGFNNTCALYADGLYCWGANMHGQLGPVSAAGPVLITFP